MTGAEVVVRLREFDSRVGSSLWTYADQEAAREKSDRLAARIADVVDAY